MDRALVVLLLLFLLGLAVPRAAAQTSPDTYWVEFTDKEGTPYSLQAPEEFLSARAIQRRMVQGIALDVSDLPVDPEYVEAVESIEGVNVLNRSKWLNAVTIQVQDPVALSVVNALPFVAQVRMRGTGHGYQEAPDELRGQSWSDQRDVDTSLYGAGFRQIEMLNGHLLHDLNAKGQGMLIGVLDSGFDGVDSSLAFEPLRSRDGIIATRDLVAGDGDVYADHWHGRSVLSCMAAELDGQLIGTAPGADYVLLRTEEVASEYPVEEDHWISGAELADSLGCDVLNTSLGYTVFDDSTMDHTYDQLDGQTLRISIAAALASQKGMVPVFSAGNNGASEWFYISAPADALDVLAVGAVGALEEHAPFSSHGPSADGRVKPDVCAMGWGTTVLNVGVDSVVQANGTSFAAPVLAGLVACLWQLHPEQNASAIMDAVRRSAHLFNAPNDSLGNGVPDFAAAHAWLQLNASVAESNEPSTRIWPVPFADELKVMDPRFKAGPAYGALFDARGDLVRSFHVNTLADGTVAVSGLGALLPGNYLIKLVQGEVVIQRSVLRSP